MDDSQKNGINSSVDNKQNKPKPAAGILFSFQGRIPRSRFWAVHLGIFACLSLLGVIIEASGIRHGASPAVNILTLTLFVPLVWVSVANQIKRWHDMGRGGWLVLAGPFAYTFYFAGNDISASNAIVFILVLVLGCKRGTVGANKYGNDPLRSTASGGRKSTENFPASHESQQLYFPDKVTTEALHAQTKPAEIREVSKDLPASIASTDELFSQDKASLPNPTITQEHVSISLVESSTLGDAGPGGDSFQKAIQNMNNRDDAAAIRCFEEALIKGIDPLRQGYVHANLGEMYIRANAIEKALDEFKKVLNFKEALYESVHTSAQYLSLLYRELGQPEVVNVLEQLKYKTSSKINTSLSPETVERVRQLAINNKSRLIERESTASTLAEDGNKTKIWKEKDNRGTRQETYQEAVAFWLARNASKKLDPFILYTFDNEENARKALLDTGVVHRTGDSGKLICTETLTFGYYRRDDGKYEAILCGDDLARDLWVKTKECFLKYGGILNNEQEPIKDIRTVAQKSVTDIQKVKFLREDRTSDVGQTAIYRIHTAPDALTAKAFLEQDPISQKFFYLVVETPEGNYCRDIAGIYKE